jgi:DNA-binding NarL/FixJ family response regulator
MIRVLLCDDQAVVRTGLATVLGAEQDIEVVGEVDDGSRVPAAVARLHPDVVVMDIRMPGTDGITATTELQRTGLPPRVCILTTYGLDEYVFDALEAGASGFLLKTDSPDRMAATIRAVADGEFALGAEATALVARRFVRGPRPSSSAGDPLTALTPREREVFTLVASGRSNAEIAEQLVVGQGTVKTHVARILTKLQLRDRLQVVLYAHRHGIAGRA